jgi:hypothetical protein
VAIMIAVVYTVFHAMLVIFVKTIKMINEPLYPKHLEKGGFPL